MKTHFEQAHRLLWANCLLEKHWSDIMNASTEFQSGLEMNGKLNASQSDVYIQIVRYSFVFLVDQSYLPLIRLFWDINFQKVPVKWLSIDWQPPDWPKTDYVPKQTIEYNSCKISYENSTNLKECNLNHQLKLLIRCSTILQLLII